MYFKAHFFLFYLYRMHVGFDVMFKYPKTMGGINYFHFVELPFEIDI